MNESTELSEDKPKDLHWVWIFQLALYLGWFTYIYGILGHVCPAAYLGVWHTALLAVYAWKEKTPSFKALFLSFIIVFIIWGLTFFFLHPPVSDVPVVTVGPFITIILTFIITLGFLSRFLPKEPRKYERITITIVEKTVRGKVIEGTEQEREVEHKPGLKFDGMMVGTTISVVFLASIFYLFTPGIKEIVWNDNPQSWFDTVFYPGDIWRLFLFIACIGLFSSVCMLIAILQWKKNKEFAAKFRILGYTILGMVFVGTIALFVFLRSIEIEGLLPDLNQENQQESEQPKKDPNQPETTNGNENSSEE